MAKNNENGLNIKEMVPPEDKALVYFIRPQTVGRIVEIILECNGKYIATTKGKRFVYLLLDPGPYTFDSISKNKSSVQLNVEAGLSYFILQKIKVVREERNHTTLELMEEVTGREKLKKCSLIPSSYGQTPESSPPAQTSKEKKNYVILALLVIILGLFFIIWGISDIMRA